VHVYLEMGQHGGVLVKWIWPLIITIIGYQGIAECGQIQGN
jgi:hypothetical protein